MRMVRPALAAALVAQLGFQASSALADGFDEYGANGLVYTINAPAITSGYGYALATFPTGSPNMGSFPLAGRMLLAANKKLYLQSNFGASVWIEVANTGSTAMDPSFLAISSNGQQIFLGTGWGIDSLLIPTSLLSASSPPNVATHASVKHGPNDYYDGTFHGDCNLASTCRVLLNRGSFTGSEVISWNFAAATPSIVPVIEDIPGASSGVAFDPITGAVVTGNGWDPGYTATGELRIYSASDITTALAGAPLDYLSDGEQLADNILSATGLGFDDDGTLHVGGGDAFGSGGAAENGYFALVRQSVVANALLGAGPVNEASSSQYRELAPDACRDDASTAPIVYNRHTEAIAAMWNPSSNGGACYAAGSAQDYWGSGVQGKITQYFVTGAIDTDGDGVPDGADNAYNTANASQCDSDGDGWGNAADADLNNNGTVNAADMTIFNAASGKCVGTPGYNAHADFDCNGCVNAADLAVITARMGSSVPFK